MPRLRAKKDEDDQAVVNRINSYSVGGRYEAVKEKFKFEGHRPAGKVYQWPAFVREFLDIVGDGSGELAKIVKLTSVPEGAKNAELEDLLFVGISHYFTPRLVKGEPNGLRLLALMNRKAHSVSAKQSLALLRSILDRCDEDGYREVMGNLEILKHYVPGELPPMMYLLSVIANHPEIYKWISAQPAETSQQEYDFDFYVRMYKLAVKESSVKSKRRRRK